MNITLPEFSLVVLIGASGSGKSTFARTHFLPSEVISSDFCRGLVSDDENNQAASNDAFDVLHYIAAKRLANMKLTVIDATNVQAAGRKPLLDLARTYYREGAGSCFVSKTTCGPFPEGVPRLPAECRPILSCLAGLA